MPHDTSLSSNLVDYVETAAEVAMVASSERFNRVVVVAKAAPTKPPSVGDSIRRRTSLRAPSMARFLDKAEPLLVSSFLALVVC